MKNVIHFLVYNYIFIALCAVAMFLQMDMLFNEKLHSIYFYSFIFCSTLFSYHVYYIKSNFNKKHLVFVVVSALWSLLTFFKIDESEIHYQVLITLAILSLTYIIPPLLGIKNKTITVLKLFILTTVWFLTTTILPIHFLHFSYIQIGFLLHQYLFIFVLCFHFYVRDEMELQIKKYGLWLIFFINVILLIMSYYAIIIDVYSYTLVNLFLFFVTRKIYKKQPNHFFYLTIVDGMMLLQSIFTIIIFKFL